MSSSSSSAKSKRSARRCLFGRADPALTQQWLSEKLDEIRRREEAKWGFNFSCETPVPGTSEYVFSPIAEDSVPEFYRYGFYYFLMLSSFPRFFLCISIFLLSFVQILAYPSRTKLISSTVSSPTKENQVEVSTSDDSDSSMMDVSMSPITPAKREHATPKKRHGKVTGSS